MLLRGLLLLGAIWLSIELLLTSGRYPPLDEMAVFEGKVSAVETRNIRRTVQKVIVLDTDNGRKEFYRYARDINNFLGELLDKEIKIWSAKLDVRFVEVDYIAEISLNGEKLLNDWHLVQRRHANSKKNSSLRIFISAFFLVFLPAIIILLLSKKPNR